MPIPSSRKLERLEENIGAVAVELTLDDLGEIENAMSQITVIGDRIKAVLRAAWSDTPDKGNQERQRR